MRDQFALALAFDLSFWAGTPSRGIFLPVHSKIARGTGHSLQNNLFCGAGDLFS
jgi:hypothetical protein